jgi:hypothetical protein
MPANWTKVCAVAALVLALGSARAEDPPAPTRAHYKTATNNLKQIGLAFHNYESAYAYFPGNIEDKDGKPLLSWRVAILPFIEEDALYKEFKLDEPWDSEHNKKLIAKMPKLYAPVRVKAKEGETFYQRFSGPDTLLEPKKKVKIISVTDGLSNTGLVFEAGEPVIWTKPADMPFDAKKQLPKLGGLFDGQCHVVLCDGSVIRMKKDPDEKELKKFIMPSDGEVIDLDKLTK